MRRIEMLTFGYIYRLTMACSRNNHTIITFLTYLNFFFSSEEKVMTISELIFVIMFLAQALNSIKDRGRFLKG